MDKKSERVIFLIDGFNLYHSITALKYYVKVDCRWLNISALCRSYLSELGKRASLVDIFYFSAIQHYLEKENPKKN